MLCLRASALLMLCLRASALLMLCLRASALLMLLSLVTRRLCRVQMLSVVTCHLGHLGKSLFPGKGLSIITLNIVTTIAPFRPGWVQRGHRARAHDSGPCALATGPERMVLNHHRPLQTRPGPGHHHHDAVMTMKTHQCQCHHHDDHQYHHQQVRGPRRRPGAGQGPPASPSASQLPWGHVWVQAPSEPGPRCERL